MYVITALSLEWYSATVQQRVLMRGVAGFEGARKLSQLRPNAQAF